MGCGKVFVERRREVMHGSGSDWHFTGGIIHIRHVTLNWNLSKYVSMAF